MRPNQTATPYEQSRDRVYLSAATARGRKGRRRNRPKRAGLARLLVGFDLLVSAFPYLVPWFLAPLDAPLNEPDVEDEVFAARQGGLEEANLKPDIREAAIERERERREAGTRG